MSYFLVTSALSEFWDTGLRLLFLNQGCIRYRYPNHYKDYFYEIVADPWSNPENLQRAQIEIEDLYQKFLPQLASKLNEIHKLNHSTRYWEILLGSWLRMFLSVIHDRYTCITAAYEKYPDLQTVTLHVIDYVIPATHQYYSSLLLLDFYNLQIASVILDYLKKSTKKIITTAPSCDASSKKPFFKTFIRKIANGFFTKIASPKQVVIAESGISFSALIKLFIKSRGGIVPMTYFDPPKTRVQVDWALRNKFKNTEANEGLNGCITNALKYFIPAAYVENYKSNIKAANNITYEPAAIFSAMGWHYNEIFKFYVAAKQEQGVKLIGHQHGGDYGILNYHSSELHEKQICDYYLSWGWSAPKVQGFTSLKLRETKKVRPTLKLSKPQYLYGTAACRRYLLRYNYSVSSILNYFEQQKLFIEKLPIALLERLQVRLYPIDWGWDRLARWRSVDRKIHFQDTAIPFKKAISACDLYIADNISTTFNESLMMNKPTLIIADPQMWPIREAAKPYFSALEECGIYHTNVSSAVHTLTEIDDHLRAWWHDKKRQAAVMQFRTQFCNPATPGLDEWVEVLRLNAAKELVCMEG